MPADAPGAMPVAGAGRAPWPPHDPANAMARSSPTLLVIAFHFPPNSESSGLQRALKFVTYLREHGWRPVVLSAHPRAYAYAHDAQLAEIPADVPVSRAFALDATRHLAVFGRYPDFLAWPDAWWSWWFAGVAAGWRLIRRHRPAVIWSTFPITTACLIALTLARLSGLPWVLDFRDPITKQDYPARAGRRRLCRWIEQWSVRRATRCVFTTRRTLELYAARYPGLAARSVCIPNGYDEADFPVVPAGPPGPAGDRPLTLVHSGALHYDGRNPREFFRALGLLQARGVIPAGSLRVVLRDAGHEDEYAAMVREHDIAGLVEFAGFLPHEEACAELLEADGLLLFQGRMYNEQIPAKLYEYLYAQRPVFGLLDAAGDTAAQLRELGVDTMASLDDAAAIADGLARFLDQVRAGTAPVAPAQAVRAFSRRSETAMLAGLLDEVVGARD